MNNPQVIRTAGGEEGGALTRIAAAALGRLNAGHDVLLPAKVAEQIARGGSAIKAVREWRGLTQKQLAEKARTDQGMISALEWGRRRGSVAVLRAIALALDVPMDLIVPDPAPGSVG